MKQKMKVKRLESRQRDFDAMKNATDEKTKFRMSSGGLHRPGSMSK